ncbi:DUF2279 domain-containing protein [Winogradskyella aurantia]|uniref:DUF2279 domain-containing protein n=1 Tax=Winogradskyella aurantia TaxID=1915063 RepID=A0A265UMW6_9FLAO|nr:DUF2279 domain-containing protein [Winogradskyella aurantia]OZV66417.1 DUF2279 domain-containing protein [Winogradskyella aurantia]
MRKRFFVLLAFLFLSVTYSQSGINRFLKPSDTLNTSRRNAVVISEVSLATLTLLGLNQLWYADYTKSSFKTVNDSREWRQMDKFGHVFSSYQLGRLGANALNWAGVGRKDQLIYGSTLGLGFLTAVEIMDGFSDEWGFSWADMAANAMGTGLYVGQELLWRDQRLLLKYSFHRTDFAQVRPNVLGDGLAEEFLKDYNGQTYWLSANINSFLKLDFIPDWLNLAFGYGADGMLTGNPNDPSFENQQRISQYYLSLDIDLSRIKTKSHLLKTIFDVLNVIKVPFPTLELNSQGQLKGYILYF